MKKQLLALSVFVLLIISMSPIHALGTDLVSPSLVIGGTQGSADGEFNEPDSVYIDGDGIIYAGDTENLRVQVFSSDGTFKFAITAGFTSLTSSSGNEVQGIGELSNGTLVVVEKAGNIFLFNKTNGDLLDTINLVNIITSDAPVDTQGLAVDMNTDIIYFSNQPEHQIYGIYANGTTAVSFTTGLYSTPENIALSADYIYVSLEGHRKIAYYNYDGTLVGDFGRDDVNENYEGLAIDSDGFIWAVDEGPDSLTAKTPSRIIMFSPENHTALYAFGGETPGSIEGNFFSPDGIAYDSVNNRLFVADQGNYRVQVFDITTILAQKAVYVEPETSAATTTTTTATPSSPSASNNAETPIDMIFAITGIAVIILSRRK